MRYDHDQEQTPLNNPSVPLHEQILALGMLAGQIHAALQPVQATLPPRVLGNASNLEFNLQELSQKVTAFEEQRSKLLALADTAQAVNSSLELNEVLRLVMDTIVRLTAAERGFLMLRNEQGEMVTRVARNWEQESINPNEFAISRTVIQRVFDTGEAVLTTNAQEDPRFGGQASIVAYNLRSILCVPLKAKAELLGVIYADNRIRSGIFSEAERDLLMIFANQAAIAIENTKLMEETIAAREALESRKLVERAKGILMKDNHIDEEAAYRIIHKKSMDSRKSMKEIAEAILMTYEIKKGL